MKICDNCLKPVSSYYSEARKNYCSTCYEDKMVKKHKDEDNQRLQLLGVKRKYFNE